MTFENTLKNASIGDFHSVARVYAPRSLILSNVPFEAIFPWAPLKSSTFLARSSVAYRRVFQCIKSYVIPSETSGLVCSNTVSAEKRPPPVKTLNKYVLDPLPYLAPRNK